MAQTYGVMDVYSLPLHLFAILACGLPEDSRIKIKLSGVKVSYKDIVQAQISDLLSKLLYSFQAFAGGKPKEPGSLVDIFLGKEDRKTQAFMTYEDFNRVRAEIMKDGEEVEDGF